MKDLIWIALPRERDASRIPEGQIMASELSKEV